MWRVGDKAFLAGDAPFMSRPASGTEVIRYLARPKTERASILICNAFVMGLRLQSLDPDRHDLSPLIRVSKIKPFIQIN